VTVAIGISRVTFGALDYQLRVARCSGAPATGPGSALCLVRRGSDWTRNARPTHAGRALPPH